MAGGIMQTLVEVFKTGHRDDLITRVKFLFEPILKSTSTNKFMQKSSNLKKAKVNLAQRIGCIFLKPKVAKWRYQRGHRSLTQNLMDSGVTAQIISNTGQATNLSAQAASKDVQMKEEEGESSGGEDDLEDD